MLACNGAEPETESDGDGDGDGPRAESTGAMMDSSGAEASVDEPQELSRADGWGLDAAGDDPFVDRPDFVQCEIGWDVVTGGFEVDTSVCTYAAFVQPTLVAIEAGDTLEFRMQHGALDGDGQHGPGHVGIAFGEEIAWDVELSIPTAAGEVGGTWTTDRSMEVGTPMHLHVHDPEGITYRMLALTVTRP